MPYPDNLNDFDLGYLVGIFEGEGCIAFNYSERKDEYPREYYTVHIVIGNTNKKLLKNIQNITGLGKVLSKGKPIISKYKECFIWRISKQKEVLWFLKQCFPYLIEKKEKAKLVMPFLESRIKCNPNEKANRNRKYSKYERNFYKRYQNLKSYIPTYIRNSN